VQELKDDNLLEKVRGGFVSQGTSLSEFCRDNGILRETAYKVLTFKRNGKKAQEDRVRLMTAANIEING